MFKPQKNEKALKELKDYAKSINKPLNDVLVSDEHLDKVAGIFYNHMPKMVRMAMKLDKFTVFYKQNRQMFAGYVK